MNHPPVHSIDNVELASLLPSEQSGAGRSSTGTSASPSPLSALSPTTTESKTNGASSVRSISRRASLVRFLVVLLLSVIVGCLVLIVSRAEISNETAAVTHVESIVREHTSQNDSDLLKMRIRRQDDDEVLDIERNEPEHKNLEFSTDNSNSTDLVIQRNNDKHVSREQVDIIIKENVEFISTQPKDHQNTSHHSQFSRVRTRWTPIGNECEEGFRLANTTNLHCGYNGLSDLSPEGDKCGGVPLHPGYCVLPTRGRWVAPLANETKPPHLLPRRFGIYDSQTKLPRCKSVSDFLNGTYSQSYGPSEFDREWMPHTCSSVPLDPYTWSQHKCQTTITMMGDSHVRNLFTATVNGLRAMEHFAEAHPGDNIKERGIIEAYEWRMYRNGSATDRVNVYLEANEKQHTIFEPCPCDSNELVRCLRVGFIWAPMFLDQIGHLIQVRKWKSDIIIVEPGNVYEPDIALSTEWTAEFDKLLSKDENVHIGILHWPWGNQPKDRVSHITNWTASKFALRKSYWQHNSGFHDNHAIQGSKTWHFACSLSKENTSNDKILAVEPCTDQVDTSQIRAFVTVHFDALKH